MIGKRKLRQLKTGVHLVCVTDVIIVKDDDGKIIKTKEGETGIVIRFSTGDNLHFDQEYWINGTRQSFFLKMCASAKIDPSNQKFKAEATGKRLWICIKEVYDIDGDKVVLDELEQPVINYYLFDTLTCLDPNKKPIIPGDPGLDNIASGAFLDYRQIPKPILNYHGDIIGVEYTDKLTIEEIAEKYPLTEKEVFEITDITKHPLQKPIEKSNDPINWDEL